jgi:3-oxoacyl-[acyl-carrier protein] reductase
VKTEQEKRPEPRSEHVLGLSMGSASAVPTNRRKTMTFLMGKSAVVLAAGGSIGGAVAKELAAQGAEVFLSGRTKSSVEQVSASIISAGGRAHVDVVDAEDEKAVEAYIASVAERARYIDVVFNAMGPSVADYGNGKLAVDLTVDEYVIPMNTLVRSQFITTRAAARQMLKQHFGVIIFVTGSPARGHVPGATAIGTAFGAIETLMENLAVELSPAGVRVVCLRTTTNMDSRTIQETMALMAQQMGRSMDDVAEYMASFNFLKTQAKVADTAQGIAYLASDHARMVTGTVVNATAGAALD